VDPEHKELFYLVTREQYIQEILDDYSNGKTVTLTDVSNARKRLCSTYGIANHHLNTLQRMEDESICFICNRNFTEKDLTAHIRKHHNPTYPISQDADRAYDLYSERIADVFDQEHQRILDAHVGDFCWVQNEMNQSKFRNYRCLHCDYTF